ncbi:hypothetical protein AOR13_109 [Alteromonas stellipolaris LMG 21856]|nr:hypothetical protein AOR13_109 [Alteromonas stellipolaris LMG 21856]
MFIILFSTIARKGEIGNNTLVLNVFFTFTPKRVANMSEQL